MLSKGSNLARKLVPFSNQAHSCSAWPFPSQIWSFFPGLQFHLLSVFQNIFVVDRLLYNPCKHSLHSLLLHLASSTSLRDISSGVFLNLFVPFLPPAQEQVMA